MAQVDPKSSAKQNEVTEYMVRSLDGSAHESLYATPGSGIIYRGSEWIVETAESDFNYDELYVSCFAARDELIEAANSYCKKRKLPNLDMETNGSWSTVETSLMAACDVLDGLATSEKTLTGISGRLKRAYSKLCEYAGVGATLCALVPEEFMCAVTLRGGLKMVFTALQQSHMYGEDVYRALEDIPFIINQHAPYIDMYRKNKDLHAFNSSLHASIFRLMKLLLSWFSESRALTTLKMGFNPKRFPERLKEHIADVKIAESRFEKHASLIRNMETRQFQQQTVTELQFLEHKLSKSGWDRERYARAGVLESVGLMLEQTWEAMLKTGRHGTPDPRQAILYADSVREQILTQCNYNPSVVGDDCTSLMKIRGRLLRDELDQERITALLGNPRLLAWLVLDQPSIMLLEGGADRSANNETSFVAAKVIQSALELCEQPINDATVIPLAFFCARHQLDEYGNVAQLVLSLFLTLVDTYTQFDAHTLEKCLKKINRQDLKSIFDAFEKLILSLPSKVIVLLVIDGLRRFSQPSSRAYEMDEVISWLLNLYRRRPQATLKFLFTSPSRSDPLFDSLAGDEILRISRELPPRGGHGGTKWKAKIEFGGI